MSELIHHASSLLMILGVIVLALVERRYERLSNLDLYYAVQLGAVVMIALGAAVYVASLAFSIALWVSTGVWL